MGCAHSGTAGMAEVTVGDAIRTARLGSRPARSHGFSGGQASPKDAGSGEGQFGLQGGADGPWNVGQTS